LKQEEEESLLRSNERKTKVYVEGHGCSASLADTEILSGIVSQGGYELVSSDEDADLSILVTCTVKTVTEQRMISRIRELSANGSRKVVVAGCLPKADPGKVLQINPIISMIGPGNLDKVLPAIDATLKGSQHVSTQTSKLVKLGLPRTRKNNTVGVIEIASGCLSSCTFCQVKLVKGTIFSYPEDSIVEEAKRLIELGAREIWLTSTDNAAYGRDSKTTLARLVKRVASLEGDFMIRVGMMNPLLTGRMLDDLISAFENEKVFKFLHLPVQSGSNRILKQMQRGYAVDDYFETVNAFRSAIPSITISTDIIVGFPSETEGEFQESMELLRKSSPDVVNLSRFGARPGTKAAIMENQISAEISKDRSARMTMLAKEIARKKNGNWMGWVGKVTIDEIGKGALIGRNYAYKPCVLKEEDFPSGIRNREELMGSSLVVRVSAVTASTLRVSPIEIKYRIN